MLETFGYSLNWQVFLYLSTDADEVIIVHGWIHFN